MFSIKKAIRNWIYRTLEKPESPIRNRLVSLDDSNRFMCRNIEGVLGKIETVDERLIVVPNAETIRRITEEQTLRQTNLIREELLRDKVIHCKDSGVSMEKYHDNDIIVSLTTYGKRVYDVCLTIESIMQGTLLPNRIVLWLDKDSFNDNAIPRTLKYQQKRGLEIKYVQDIRSYTKIIPALKQYPNDVIVTIDDDVIYHYDMLEKLIASYKKHPYGIHANRIHRMTYDESGELKSYMDWEWRIGNTNEMSDHFFFTGIGGVLYAPNSLDSEVLNQDVFMDICKFADDVWLNAMARLANSAIFKVETHSKYGDEFEDIMDNKEEGLCYTNTNASMCRNDVYIKEVFSKYNI